MVQNPDTIDIRHLSPAQWEGRACVRCGSEKGPFQPIVLIIGTTSVIHYAGGCVENGPAQSVSAA